MQSSRKAPITSAITVAALAGVSYASVIPPMEIPELYQRANIVVHGQIIDQASRWESIDGNELIFTYSTVLVSSSAKAPANSRLMMVRSVGGSVDGYNQTMIGEASVNVGEEVVLFVEQPEGWSSAGVLGMHYGKFGVTRDAQGAVSLVRDAGQAPGATPKPLDQVGLNSFMDSLQRIEAGQIDEHGHDLNDEIHTLTPANQLDSRTVGAQPRTATPVAASAGLTFQYAAPTCPDLNADGMVDVSDLSEMVSAWGDFSPTADLDGSGTVDVLDLSSLAQGWGSCR